jgi:hypothetical protein
VIEKEIYMNANQMPIGKNAKLNKCPTITVDATLLGST